MGPRPTPPRFDRRVATEFNAAARAAAGTGFDLETLVKAGLEHMRQVGAGRADASLTLAQASERVIADAVRTGARPKTVLSYRKIYAAMNKVLGNRVAAALTQADVQAYLDGLPDRTGAGGKASLATKSGRLNHVRMAMRAAGILNPVPGIVVPEDESDVEFFSIPEVKRILGVARSEERGFLAIALFGCVRPENLELLPEDVVSLELKRIRIPKGVAKDRVGHLLDEQLPPVLWRWLESYPFKPLKWAPLQRRLKRALGRWIHDGVRHTGATYYCALNGVSKTAQLLTHESEKLVRRNYAGMVNSHQDARDFMDLGPEKIAFRAEQKPVVWPDDKILAEMLKSRTAVDVAAQIGVSDVALSKRCKARGIEKPGRGWWTKQQHFAKEA